MCLQGVCRWCIQIITRIFLERHFMKAFAQLSKSIRLISNQITTMPYCLFSAEETSGDKRWTNIYGRRMAIKFGAKSWWQLKFDGCLCWHSEAHLHVSEDWAWTKEMQSQGQQGSAGQPHINPHALCIAPAYNEVRGMSCMRSWRLILIMLWNFLDSPSTLLALETQEVA